ncbi:MAG TPA: dynamin family protein, partial [Candidatus Limnocylindrales bacterium]|nr:dynamin family protein [Candidatus Limnocylindrales bacterium]
MPAEVMVAPATEQLDAVVGDVRSIARNLDRDDLADRLDDIRRRAARTDTVVCVVGEFKKGKSALINALLGAPVCPVDDDLATAAVTVVRYGETPSATVHRREGGEAIVEAIEPTAVPDWAQEPVGRDHRPQVDLVEVRIPNPLLEGGLTLVDTPGVGGLNAGHAAATLAFLPSADALVFVTDASAELSGPELEF